MLSRRQMLCVTAAALIVPLTAVPATAFPTISAQGLAIIKRHEGRRLRAYRDPVGVWTIGYGHTSRAGAPRVRRGMRISEAEAERILLVDIGRVEAAIRPLLRRTPTQHQHDAMVSLAFNIGTKAFARSSVLRFFNAGEYRRSADAFRLFVKGGRPKRTLPGLKRRRAAERRHFLIA
jgi:GH24 family phage-related lysozyme (muramidase)